MCRCVCARVCIVRCFTLSPVLVNYFIWCKLWTDVFVVVVKAWW